MLLGLREYCWGLENIAGVEGILLRFENITRVEGILLGVWKYGWGCGNITGVVGI